MSGFNMSSSLLKNIKDVFTKMQPTLPYLVMVGILTSAELPFLLLIPIVLELIEWGYTWFKSRSNGYTLEVKMYDDYHQSNIFYKIITFLLEHHNLLILAKTKRINGGVSNANQRVKIGNTSWAPDTPIVAPCAGFKIPFKHDNFSVHIELVEYVDKEYTYLKYVITTQKQSDLAAFISYVNGLQLEYAQKMYHENKEPVLYQFHKNEFKDNPINVKKTFRNIFLDRMIKEKLKAQLDNFVNGKERYDELGIAYRTGYLLYLVAHEYD
jgi:hypothetical protein